MCLLILIPHLKKTPHEYICHFFIFMIFSNSYFVMTVFEKDSKYLIWNFSILAFFTFLVLLKMTFLVTLFGCKFKIAFFGTFNELLATQNVNVARFARNVEWDFLIWFSNTVMFYIDIQWIRYSLPSNFDMTDKCIQNLAWMKACFKQQKETNETIFALKLLIQEFYKIFHHEYHIVWKASITM